MAQLPSASTNPIDRENIKTRLSCAPVAYKRSNARLLAARKVNVALSELRAPVFQMGAKSSTASTYVNAVRYNRARLASGPSGSTTAYSATIVTHNTAAVTL